MLIVDFFRLARAACVLAREGVLSALPLPEPRPFAVNLALMAARLIERRGKLRTSAERLTAAGCVIRDWTPPYKDARNMLLCAGEHALYESLFSSMRSMKTSNVPTLAQG